MKNMTLWNIARACQGRLVVPTGKRPVCPGSGIGVIRRYSGKEAAGIVLDSRKVEPGFAFVATKGERVDGHRFIPEVFEKGAIGVVCEQEPKELPGPGIIAVSYTHLDVYKRQTCTCMKSIRKVIWKVVRAA